MSSLIIENPHRQGLVRRFIQGAITLAFWGIWLYLMLPLLTPLIAMAGIEHALLSSLEPIDYLRYILPIILFVGALMLGMELWVRYNIFLHRRSHRQKRKKTVYRTQIAKHFDVPLNDLTGWHHSGRMIIRMTEHGKVYDVEVKPPLKSPVPLDRRNRTAANPAGERMKLRPVKNQRRTPLGRRKPRPDNPTPLQAGAD